MNLATIPLFIVLAQVALKADENTLMFGARLAGRRSGYGLRGRDRSGFGAYAVREDVTCARSRRLYAHHTAITAGRFRGRIRFSDYQRDATCCRCG